MAVRSLFRVTPEFAQRVSTRHSAGMPFRADEVARMNRHEYLYTLNDAAEMQRGVPESLMLRAQKAVGGGLWTHALEHVGDIYHRAGESVYTLHGFNPEAVVPKVDRIIGYMDNPYGFAKEHMENVRSNRAFAERNGRAYPTDEEIRQLGEAYAAAHEGLIPYTPAMLAAMAASVRMGRQDFKGARESLGMLQRMVSTPENWDKAMGQESSVKLLSQLPAQILF